MSNQFQKRINKEYARLQSSTPDGIILLNGSDLQKMQFEVKAANNDLYGNQAYCLQIILTSGYPVDSPQVQFIKKDMNNVSYNIPIHPHIYSNGHICLDLLGSGWTPVCNLSSTLVSIHSLLASNSRNERPPDDERYSRHAPSNPKKANFVYDDDTV